MKPAAQLIFDLPVRPALRRADFLVAPCNEEAVALIDTWPEWPEPVQAIYGAGGSGKTHLVSVWRQMGKIETLDDLTAAAPPESHDGLAVDAVGDTLSAAESEALFHLINHARASRKSLLLVSRVAPAHIETPLPDLVSRLRAIPAIALRAPDDTLLAGLLRKLLADRDMDAPQAVVDYLLPRMERDFAAIERLVAALDRAALTHRRALTVPLASDVLAEKP